ncbi:MAG: helix-turn-helix domain-containing protein [Eubacterium sp.]|nr:helix-turn-helix domain-containing protein [Eubacterium sp.]
MQDEDNRIAIGERIRSFRISKEFSQQDFAESIDISTPFLSSIENGRRGISFDTLYKLCAIHNISADYILFGNRNKKNPSDEIINLSNQMDINQLKHLLAYIQALIDMKE